MEAPTFSITLNPPADLLEEECVEPGVVVAIIELEPKISGLCHHSSPFTPKKGCPTSEKQACLRLELLLKEITHILQSMGSYEDVCDPEAKDKAWEKNCCFCCRSLSDEAFSLEEKAKGPEKPNKASVHNPTSTEKEKNLKKQERAWKNRKAKHSKHGYVRHSGSDPEPTKAHSDAQVSKVKMKHRHPDDHEDKNRAAQNTEQLLQEVEQWCVQHSELTELIRSYQKAQENPRRVASNQEILPSQPNQESAKLEEEVKKLKHETYSLNLFATLLDNECRILKQRLELFKELKHHGHGREEKPSQKSPELNKDLAPSETEKETFSQRVHDIKGSCQRKEKVCTSLDFCCNKKACHNRLNLRIARKVLWGRKKNPAV